MNQDSSTKTKKCKAYSVIIHLEIQAITCPGVWLCNNGKVTMQIFLLGLCTQTATMNPVFPLLCHEKFIFRKNFSNIKNLCDIDRKLGKEVVYIELIQWENCETGTVLATFKTSLKELLYPFPSYCKGVIAGVDVDLLMEATRIFPGIIAPKVEISTKFTIEEVLCTVKHEKQSDLVVINPKLISSKCIPKRSVPMHQRKVCHNNKYHKGKTSPKLSKKKVCCESGKYSPRKKSPPRSPRLVLPRRGDCNICDTESDDWVTEKIRQLRSFVPDEPKCTCKDNKVSCHLCTKYKSYFRSRSPNNSHEDTFRRNSHRKSNMDDEMKQHKIYDSYISEKSSKLPRTNRNTRNLSKPKNSNDDEKLQRVLSTTSCATYLSLINNTCDDSCNERFYKNLEHFYKQLYLRAHYKLKNQFCKCSVQHNANYV